MKPVAGGIVRASREGARVVAQVIDLISLKPFDMEAITTSVKKTKRVIIVEECMKTGGIGASLSATINESCFDDLDHQVPRASSPVPAAIPVSVHQWPPVHHMLGTVDFYGGC